MNSKYKRMTVNERLFISNLDTKFYNAVREKNVEIVIEILKEVELSDESTINPTLEQFGLTRK
jgi:hypothetical protein